MFTEIHCKVEGRVQQVGFRDFVQQAAKEHRLMGWVKNNEDGTVAILAQGIPNDLKDFIEELNSGSPLAKVESVGVDWQSVTKLCDDFTVIFP